MVIITRKAPPRKHTRKLIAKRGRKDVIPQATIRKQQKDFEFSPALHLGEQSFTRESVLRSVCKESYFEFVKAMWNTVVPEKPVWNWHIERQCHPASTMVETPCGQKTIGELVESRYTGEVLGYDTKTSQPRWVQVSDWVKHPGRTAYRLQTPDGELTATYDHPVYVKGKGYVACREVEVGDVVLRAVRKPVLRIRGDDSTHSQVLQSSMLRQIQTTCVEQVSVLQKENPQPQNETLSGVSDVATSPPQQEKGGLRGLWSESLQNPQGHPSSQEASVRGVLLPTVFRSIRNRSEQSRVHSRQECHPGISLHGRVLAGPQEGVTSGQSRVFPVRSHEGREQLQATGLSSHRLEPAQQQDLEHGHALSQMSQPTERGRDAGRDYEVVESVVSAVVQEARVPEAVYCLTVDHPDHNYFADGILVHNCHEIQMRMERIFADKPKEDDLLYNQPPGTSKSTTFSIMLVPWAWTRMPSFRAIHACHTFQPLAMNLSRLSRQVIQSDLYGKLFPEVQLSKDQSAKANFANTKGGQRFAVGNSGRILGVHAHVIGMDDIISPDETISDLELERVHNWITGELLTRKVSSTISVVMQTMQRLHQDDPSARMSQRPRVTHFILPATNDFPIQPPDLVKYYKPDPEQPDNGKLYLDPIRLPQKVLDEKFAELGDYGYAGQFGEDPVPLGGGKFKVKLVKTYSNSFLKEVIHEGLVMTRSWDKAISLKKKSAYTAGVKLGRTKDGKILLLDVKRDRWDSAKRETTIRQVAQQDGYQTIQVLEQEPGSGGLESAQRSATHTLRGFRVVLLKPTSDKGSRADPLSQQVNLGNFYVPEDMYDRNGQPTGWLKTFLDEMRHFPHSKYKDQIDAASSGFMVLARKRTRIGGLKPSRKFQTGAIQVMDY